MKGCFAETIGCLLGCLFSNQVLFCGQNTLSGKLKHLRLASAQTPQNEIKNSRKLNKDWARITCSCDLLSRAWYTWSRTVFKSSKSWADLDDLYCSKTSAKLQNNAIMRIWSTFLCHSGPTWTVSGKKKNKKKTSSTPVLKTSSQEELYMCVVNPRGHQNRTGVTKTWSGSPICTLKPETIGSLENDFHAATEAARRRMKMAQTRFSFWHHRDAHLETGKFFPTCEAVYLPHWVWFVHKQQQTGHERQKTNCIQPHCIRGKRVRCSEGKPSGNRYLWTMVWPLHEYPDECNQIKLIAVRCCDMISVSESCGSLKFVTCSSACASLPEGGLFATSSMSTTWRLCFWDLGFWNTGKLQTWCNMEGLSPSSWPPR